MSIFLFPKWDVLAILRVDLWPQVDTIHSEPPTMGFAAGSTAASGGLADRICRIYSVKLERYPWKIPLKMSP